VFTIDASVHINAVNPTEVGSVESQSFLDLLRGQPQPVFSPTLLLVEVAASVARAKNDANRGIAIARAIRGIPDQTWVALDESLADEAVQLGAKHHLRAADAVYAAVARRHGTTLVTLDRQHLECLPSAVPVLTPTEAIAHLTRLARAAERHR
jgi:predicted nucleic acid-binding protein